MTLWKSMSEPERFMTLRHMEYYGGMFEHHLAMAWLVADSGNSRALAEAFPELIEKFQPKNWEHSREKSN